MSDTIHDMVKRAVREEMREPECLYYLSFSGDAGFLGVAIVKAHGIATAVNLTHVLGINPGGEVLAAPVLPEEVDKVPESALHRLLSADEVKAIWPDTKSIREWKEEERNG